MVIIPAFGIPGQVHRFLPLIAGIHAPVAEKGKISQGLAQPCQKIHLSDVKLLFLVINKQIQIMVTPDKIFHNNVEIRFETGFFHKQRTFVLKL
jgi:hypothetical protein